MSVVQATSSEAFVQSIGVNTHLNYLDSPDWANVSLFISSLQYLGIDHVRDALPLVGDPLVSTYTAMMALGIKFDIGVDGQPYNGSASIAAFNNLEAASPGGISSIEGFNEINNWPVTYNGQTGTSAAVLAQEALYSAVKSDPSLAGVPIYDLTDGGYTQPVDQTLVTTLNGLADFENVHVYPQNGTQPQQWIVLDQGYNFTFSAPKVLTEFGYYTYSDADGMAPNDTSGGWWGGVDQATQGKLILNGLMDAFSLGYSQTYIYDLFDAYQSTSPEDYFGIFNFNGTPKPAATDIHNLTSILTDPASNALTFVPGSLNYSISNLPSTGNSMLLEKSSGAFDLVLWNEATDWNPITETEIAVSPTMTTVNLGIPGTVEIFDPTLGSAPIQTLTGVSSVTVGLTDHPLIVEIEPGTATTPTPPPTPTPAPTPTVITIADSEARVTVSESNISVVATSGNHMLFISGTGDHVNLSGGTDTIADTGSGNTYVIPIAGQGSDMFTSNILLEGDTLDLRTALAATNWNGERSTLKGYLTLVASAKGAVLSIRPTSGAVGVAVATIDGVITTHLRTLLVDALT
jgi:hypothetical protein